MERTNIEASMVDYYARRAQEYERIYQKPERQDELKILAGLIERTFSEKRVLEVACGTGYWTEVLARSAREVVAIDINEEVLQLARAKPIDPGRVIFQRADAYDLPSFSEKFDAALVAFWWSHVPRAKLAPFLAQLHRSLQPGAVLLFIDNTFAAGSSTPTSRTDADGNTYQTRRLDDGSVHEVLKNFPSKDELIEVLQVIASEVKIEFLTYYWIATCHAGDDSLPI